MLSKNDLIDGLLITLPALVCCIVYFSDVQFKEALTLIPANYTILTIYTTNFVHYTQNHLVGNLATYLAFALPTLLIYSKLNYRNVFRISLLLILLIVPVASSIYSMLTLPQPAQLKPAYGFSAVSSAVMGLFGFGIALSITFERKELLYSYLFLVFLVTYVFFAVYNKLILAMAFLVLAIIPFTVIARKHRNDSEKRKRIVVAYLLLIPYLLSFGIIFPDRLVNEGNFVNIFSHIAGLIFGILLPFLILNSGKMGLISTSKN